MKSLWPDRRKSIVCAALLLMTVALYWPVATYDFVDYDDPTYIVANRHINTGFRWSQARWFFQATYAGNWHPLTWFSHTLDCQLYGLWAGGHHLTNVLLHALSAMVLFLLLQRFTRAFWRAAFVAALFAWHPLHVESVAWVSERKDCLSCLLWLLALWAYLRHAENLKSQIPISRFFYWLALAFFALGLMAKPMLVTLPFALLLLDFWPLGRASSHPMRALLKEKIPFFLLSAACCVLTLLAQVRGGAMAPLQRISLAFRLCNAATSYLWYVEKMFWPRGLMVIYPLDIRSLSGWLVAAAIMEILLISCLAMLWRRTRPWFLFGWCWFLGTLVPVIGLLQVGSQAAADRYFYIPSIGLFVIMAWGAAELAARFPRRRLIPVLLAAAAAAACVAATRVQLSCWQNTRTLFSHALKIKPDNYAARAFLSSWLLDQGQLEEAHAQCERALRDSGGNPSVRHDFGKILTAEKKFDLAADQFRLSLRILPNQEGELMNLGNVLLAQNMPGEAAVQFQSALLLDPNNEDIHFYLAKAFEMESNAAEASREFARCIQLNPNDPELHARLAVLLSAQGRMAEAISHYRQALRLQPDSQEALNNLAWILASDSRAELRDGKEAVRLATRVCELTRHSKPLMIGTLAAAYAEAGRFDEAVAAAQEAHDLALAIGKKEIAEKNLEMLKLYRSHRPFHENP